MYDEETGSHAEQEISQGTSFNNSPCLKCLQHKHGTYGVPIILKPPRSSADLLKPSFSFLINCYYMIHKFYEY